jgi:formylglycine-generating enzyme required for sulfatase activity
VEGGTFFRTYDPPVQVDGVDTIMVALAPDGGPTGEANPATVSSFRLDKYDVTVGRFRQFAMAWDGGAGYWPAKGSGKHAHLNGGLGLANSEDPGTYEPGWVVSDDTQIALTNENLACDVPPPSLATWTDSPAGDENLPMVCMSWYEAYAFCIWDGGFLPSEAEWEYAAAGGGEQREYPWGSKEPGTASNKYVQYYNSGAMSFPPVGMAPLGAGRWGQVDLEGEATQWVLDWPPASFVDPCVNCVSWVTGQDAGTRWEMGCSDFYDPESLVPSRIQFSDSPSTRSGTGFRCARMP